MHEVVRNSLRASLLSAVAACAGNAAYRWWRHGSVDWAGVLEFGLGFTLTAVAIELFVRWRRQRKSRGIELSGPI